jgi:hypothetical protein
MQSRRVFDKLYEKLYAAPFTIIHINKLTNIATDVLIAIPNASTPRPYQSQTFKGN